MFESNKHIKQLINFYNRTTYYFDNFILKPSLECKYIWYFKIFNLSGTNYENGEYYGKIILPFEYPFKEPEFIILNENGRIISGFNFKIYNDRWSPRIMLHDLLLTLISIMTDSEEQIAPYIIECDIEYLYIETDEKIKQIAHESINYENDEIKTYFK